MTEENTGTVGTSCVCDKELPREVVKDSWFWIRGSDGNASVSVTFAAVAFWVTTTAYILSLFEQIGPLAIRPFDVAATSGYLIPALALYFGRRATDAKFNSNT